ncbi:MAG: dephospho-CoA kinase [Lachnospiraceae bacterium]|nr:dephospho-CoA kinase [Lachnospiraceae bacterium]
MEMLRIGLTGGVGSGKSRVIFWMEKVCGAKIIRTDELARQLMEPGREGYRRVVETLGTSCLDGEQRIDRAALAEMIFQDKRARETVNGITHPLVWEQVKRELGLVKEDEYPMAVVESALFDETSLSFLDEIWYVHASRETRMARLMESRGYSREKCEAIFSSQKSEQEFCQFCAKVIENDGDWEKTEEVLRGMLEGI